MANWLRHVANILLGKADLLDSLGDQYKSEISWMKWRYTIIGIVVGFIAGFIYRGM